MESHEDRKQAVKSSVLTDQELWAHLIIHGLQYLQVRVVDTAVIVQTLREHRVVRVHIEPQQNLTQEKPQFPPVQ